MSSPLAAQTSVRLQKKEPGGESPGVSGSDGRRWGFTMERDTSGKEDERPVLANWVYTAGKPSFNGVTGGYAPIRLYSASYLSPSLRVANADTVSPLAFLGWREERLTETLVFSGSAEAKLSKGYDASNVVVIDSTPFYAKDGSGGDTPSRVHGETGVFAAKEEVYGALVVEYTARYRVYRIPYGLPYHIQQALFVQARPVSEVSIPPVYVLAFATGGYASSLTLDRRIGETAAPGADDTECSGSWLIDKGKSDTKKIKIYDPDDLNADGSPKPDAKYIEEERYIKLVQYCSDNPEIVRVENYPSEE